MSASIQLSVANALSEDIGSGDITARLIDAQAMAYATVISRQSAILCGTAWFDEVFVQLAGKTEITWSAADGGVIEAGQVLCTITSPARTLLTGERTALNFLQMLSATATTTRRYVDIIAGTGARLLDTRKTIPGMRMAQKYAVQCGGGCNHRIGLFDAFLIKENHIIAAGGIVNACQQARALSADKLLEIEVETLDELEQALSAGVDRVMLDNFDLDTMRQAVALNRRRVALEASGNVDEHTLRSIAETGVDYISVGALTKHIEAIDLSMRFDC